LHQRQASRAEEIRNFESAVPCGAKPAKARTQNRLGSYAP
jgi:hypothetical protein